MQNLFNKFIGALRFLIIFLINSAGIFLLSRMVNGVSFQSFWTAMLVVIIFGALNAVLWPLLSRFALPLTVITLGLSSLILNGIILGIVAIIIPGFIITDIFSAIVFVFGVTVVNTIISQLLAIDDDEAYYRNVVKKQAKNFSQNSKNSKPGIIFIQIDGLSHSVFVRAMRSGDLPNLSRWIREDGYRLERWETDWSSQTGASQAGILMGNNKNIPSFRWYDKKLKKSFTVGNPFSVKEIEKSLSTGKGLLAKNGVSRGNLFSGDAQHTLMTLSTIGKKDERGMGHAYYAYFLNPYNLPRTLILFFIDVFREIKSQISQERRKVWPRLTHHKLTYPFLRAFMTVVQRDVLIQTVIADIYEGRDVVYADLAGYDEVSHHTGPERHETLAVLRDIDKQIERLTLAIKDQDKPYNIVVLSDHGQTQGATYFEKTGITLDELIQSAIGKDVKIKSDLDNTEDANYLNATALEITKSGGIIGKSVEKISKNKIDKIKKPSKFKNEDVIVLASGNLGLVYFTKHTKRLTYEEMEKTYPGLMDKVLADPLIGFIFVDSKKHGGIVLGKNGKYILNKDKIIGSNPLKNYGKNAAMHIKRTHTFTNTPDIMINSIYDPILDEACAFEEKLGSHGGLGGPQSYPFILFPSSWEYPSSHIISAENIHKLMKGWMKKQGQKV